MDVAPAPVQPALLTMDQAAIYLAVSRGWMEDAQLPRVDMRTPGTRKPMWRYRRADLDVWIEKRLTR